MRHRHEVIKADGDTVTIRVPDACRRDQFHVLDLPAIGYDQWVQGAHVQLAFPDMPAAQREILITGIGPDDFDRLIPDDDCEEDDLTPEGQ